MADFQTEKALLRRFYAALDAAEGAAINDVLAKHLSDSYLWRGFHPFHEQTSAQAVGDLFWQPLRRALRHMQRREDVFMAGANKHDPGATWVVSMGHLMGLFDAPWLGIQPTGKLALLRYCEFNRVDGDKITETAMFFDIPHLMIQAGQKPFPAQTAAHCVQPGPLTHDGLMYEAQNPEEGRETQAAIDRMIDDISSWSGGQQEPLVDELRRSWCEDMLWWGPAGIGATYTIERYAQQHSGPFRDAFRERTFNGHICAIAEGHFGGFFGWPNLTLTHHGGFMGMPATGQPGDMRVIDIYRRRGDKLAENWIFIDLLHFWNMQGIDLLKRATEIKPT